MVTRIIGTPSFDFLRGTAGNDEIFGLGGADTITATAGNDLIDGGDGFDAVVYNLNAPITLRATGIVSKASGGTDTLRFVERIVGQAGFANVVDASAITSGSTSVEINLGGRFINIFNIPGLGNRGFTIENFVNAIGTINNDTLTGSSGNNILRGLGGSDFFNASGGNDQIDGGAGFDIIDYSTLNTAITLGATGIVSKGTFGKDNLILVERIIGRAGFANTVDASAVTSGTTSVIVNLASTLLGVRNIPVLGNRDFFVNNFVNAIGTVNNDSFTGSNANNVLRGLGGNDFFTASAGNDQIDGGLGFDAVDYSQLGTAITLGPTGVITKGSFGRDTLLFIERIIARAGFANTIDASSITSGATFVNVNLGARVLVVNNIPNVGNRSFAVENFVNARGTSNADTLTGSDLNNVLSGFAGNDLFIGSRGSDRIEGGAGFDTVDYSRLNSVITLNPMGMINKSGIGNDSLFLVERIIGAAGQFNAINAAPAFGGASILVDLQNNFLRVRDIPTLGNRDFTVQNFMEVIGTVSNDSITGNNSINFLAGFDGDDFLSGLGGDDILFGDEGNDFLTGGSGNDFLRATDEFARGFAEFDDMQGGTGSDIFVLGDCDGAFYNSNGEFDDALILDFSAEDSLELGLGEVYRAVGRTGGFNLFTVNSFGLELIAQVDTTSAIALPTGNFSLLSGQRLGVFFGA